MNLQDMLIEDASVAADAATQAKVIGDTQKRDPLKYVKKELKKKKIISFKEFIKGKRNEDN